MSRSIFILSCLVLLFSCRQETPSSTAIDEKHELEKIMEVIEKETHCFFSGDYECWASTWIHENYAMQAWNNVENSYDAVVGWENIERQGRYWIHEYYGDGTNIEYPFVKREKPIVKFFDDKTAYLVWKQYNSDKNKEFFQVSQESRLMQKLDDGWKIVNVTAFWDLNSKIPIDEVTIEE